jgi:hypothetical protein
MRSKDGNLTPKEYAQNRAISAVSREQSELRKQSKDGWIDETPSFVKRADIQLAKIVDDLAAYESGAHDETHEDYTRNLYANIEGQ